MVGHWQSNPIITEPATVSVSAGSFAYRLSGEFRSDGAIVDAPLHKITFEQPLTIMKYQVSLAEYQRCVAEGACDPALDSNALDSNLPVTGVSFEDALSYARWLSRRTGAQWRLPSDAEWAFAAGNRYADDALGLADARDPSKRWLESYRREADRPGEADRTAKPPGFFGENEKGVADAAGNVWEWTSELLQPVTDCERWDSETCGNRQLRRSYRRRHTSRLCHILPQGCTRQRLFIGPAASQSGPQTCA